MTQQSNKTAVIVGTGATRGSGFTKCDKPLPGDRGFFGHDLVKQWLSNYPALNIMLDVFRLGTSRQDMDQASLEEVWTFIEFCSKRTYAGLYALQKEKTDWLEKARVSSERQDEHFLYKKYRHLSRIPEDVSDVDMSWLAGWELRLLLCDVYTDIQSSQGNPYRDLMETYELVQKETTVFINLNYDTVLEHSLQGLPWYHVHVWPTVPRENAGIQILKPHGSLNWQFRKNGMQVEITTNYELNPVPHRNWRVDCFQEAAIIQPTQLKQSLNVQETQADVTSALFDKIWKTMGDVLVEAERVFIIGYSFPGTDHHFRTALRLVNTRRQKPYREVYCCTKAEGDLEGAVFANAVRFFPCEQGHHLSDAGFEAFAKG